MLIEVKLSPEATKDGVEPESNEAAQLLERLPICWTLKCAD